MLRFYCALLFFFTICLIYSQEQTEFCSQLEALKDLVKKEHYKPKAVDDSLSANVYKLFLSRLDKEKRLFITEDLQEFSKDKYKIDDYLNGSNCSFLEKYTAVYLKRIELAESILKKLENQTFDYSGKDTISFRPDSERTYLKNKSQLNAFWNKRIRYNILFELIENDSIFKNVVKNFKALEKDIKPKIIQKELCKLEELKNKKNNLSQYVEETFLNAYLAYQDPNSTFFNTTDKTTYMNSLSQSQFSFGITTSKNDSGNIVISHITPGSPAFMDGNFETNDIIKSLEANGVVLETYCISNADVIAFTNDEAHHTITFNIKKQNGTVKSIPLTKSETKIEDNTVTGYVLENASKTGYISINNFYSDFESPRGLGVANDVAKELYKLQKEDIEGLIIDLRFNGGGSMKEAIDLSGMFINRGPLAILKYSNGETFTVRDMNRGSLFNKPIVILINAFSASASEFFAAAMQDYGRAVIIGATTHGKASAQAILPLDEDSDLGFSKLTTEKFYRITGGSHQSKGVIPDIKLPSFYDGFKTEEKFASFALQNDSVQPTLTFFRTTLPLQQLNTKTQKRIASNAAFKAIKQLNQLIIDNYFELDTAYPLTLENVHNAMNSYHSKWKTYRSIIDNTASKLVASNTSSTHEILLYDNNQKSVNSALLKDIENDIYINEAHNILLDLFNINTTN